MEIYIYILIATTETNSYCTTCAEAENFFYNDNYTLDIPLSKHKYIFLPILHRRHFTLVYINTEDKTFTYLNPAGEEDNHHLETFHRKTGTNDFTLNQMDHNIQNISKDRYNCGVYVCLFVKYILEKKV